VLIKRHKGILDKIERNEPLTGDEGKNLVIKKSPEWVAMLRRF
jgi:hypothetical protein